MEIFYKYGIVVEIYGIVVLYCIVWYCGGKPKFLWVPSPEGALSSIPGFFYCNPNFTANFEKIEAGEQNSHEGATGDQLL